MKLDPSFDHINCLFYRHCGFYFLVRPSGESARVYQLSLVVPNFENNGVFCYCSDGTDFLTRTDEQQQRFYRLSFIGFFANERVEFLPTT